ncbi:dispanin subfamily A member 2b [Bombina bombina]|uniref:dispanin subfamily A member 2b n=1 Tax=Bombina bombina TaxID=8345 RepID=UPI00235ADFBA|nr:dispanin subfamily A member 2b [Bombina bombina]
MENNFSRQPNSSVLGTGVLPLYNTHGYEPLAEELVEYGGSQRNLVQSTVVTMSSNEKPVRDHLVWSIFNLIYMNFCCLGLMALVFSVKSRDRKLVGDRNGATSYGSTSRSLNIAATTLSLLLAIITLIVVVSGVATVIRLQQQELPSDIPNYQNGK